MAQIPSSDLPVVNPNTGRINLEWYAALQRLAAASITGAAGLDSPAFTGTPTAPTPAAGDNDTSIATTAFVQGELWRRVIKTADEQLATNTTLQDDDALLFPMLASTSYVLRGEIFYDTPTAADFKWGHTGPAAPTLVNIVRDGYSPDATAPSGAGTDEAYNVAGIALTAAAGTFGWVRLSGIIRNGTTAGNFQIQWAQNASSGTTTVRAGSYLEYRTL